MDQVPVLPAIQTVQDVTPTELVFVTHVAAIVDMLFLLTTLALPAPPIVRLVPTLVLECVTRVQQALD
jgi:xanthosine utilization system XapX-like protein